MIFTETELRGAFVVDIEPIQDDRGSFARSFCRREFAAHGLRTTVEQMNVSTTRRAGTVRGLHLQVEPATESKLIRCTRGAIFDVIVDMRPGSDTYLKHIAVELTADNHRAIYVPPLFAHGHQSLVDDTEITYAVSEAFTPGAERGLRYDDPRLAIDWPLPVTLVSAKDAAWPLLEEQQTVVSR